MNVWFLIFVFLFTSLDPIAFAFSDGLVLPKPGAMVHLTPEFNPLKLKGIKIHTDDPFQLDFIIEQGDLPVGNDQQLKSDSEELIKYFLTSLTIPQKELWVNLSPYEKDRIIPESFGLTEMGRDMLAQDYILKELTSSLIYPENKLGKEFWAKVYQEAEQKYKTINIPINTFNKVWIVPEKAVVYEHNNEAYIVDSKLKVMLEEDYLSLQKHKAVSNDMTSIGANIVREVIIPQLEKEVNQGKDFAQLRQVYQSLILAAWYKRKVEKGLLGQMYLNQRKIAGVSSDDPLVKQKIYERYLAAFKKGVFNYIKEEKDPFTKESIPKKYFSGGWVSTPLFDTAGVMQIVKKPPQAWGAKIRKLFLAGVMLVALPSTGIEIAHAQDQPSMDPLGINEVRIPGTGNEVYIRGITHSTPAVDSLLENAIIRSPVAERENILRSIMQQPEFVNLLENYSRVVNDFSQLKDKGRSKILVSENRVPFSNMKVFMDLNTNNFHKFQDQYLAGISDPVLRDKLALLILQPEGYLYEKGELNAERVVSSENTYLSLRFEVLQDLIGAKLQELDDLNLFKVSGYQNFIRFKSMLYSQKDKKYFPIDDQKIAGEIKMLFSDDPASQELCRTIVGLQKELLGYLGLRNQWMEAVISQTARTSIEPAEGSDIYYFGGSVHALPIWNDLSRATNAISFPHVEGDEVIGVVKKKMAEEIISLFKSNSPELFNDWEQRTEGASLIFDGGLKGRLEFDLSNDQTALKIDHVKGEGVFDALKASCNDILGITVDYFNDQVILEIPGSAYYGPIKDQINKTIHSDNKNDENKQSDVNLQKSAKEDLGGINFDTDLLQLRVVHEKDNKVQFGLSTKLIQELKSSSGFAPLIINIKSISLPLSEDVQ